MLSKTVLQLLLSSSPAIGAILGEPARQQPLDTSSSPSLLVESTTDGVDTTKAPSYREDLLALHKSLVTIPSTSGLEHDAGDFLVDYFISKGWNYEVQSVPPRDNTPDTEARFNVIAWPHTSSTIPKPKVLVTSHIDCVPPHIPYSISPPPLTKQTRIAGRCTVDAKGSVAAQLTAVHSLLASGALQPEDVMVLYVVGEEISGDGMRVFSAANATTLSQSLRAAVFGEPTENKLACGHKGAMSCQLTATGKAGHSGYPELGKSANAVLARALVAVVDADLGSSERYGNTTVNIGMMKGGVAPNVIPAHAEATLMCRIALEPQKNGHEAVREKMEEVLKGVDGEALSLDCPVGQGATRCECDVKGEFPQCYAQIELCC